MAILIINNSVALPDPSEMTVTLQDIDSGTTTRNAKGTLIRDRVCGAADAKRKIECTWKYIKMDEAARIMRAIGDVFFSVTYPDTYTGQTRTGTFYTGDRKAVIYSCDTNGSNALLESIEAHFIER